MTALESFITRMISNAADLSTKEGKAKYAAYFVNTDIYRNCREAVDEALTERGLGKVVVK